MRVTKRGGLSSKPHRYMSAEERFEAQTVPVPEAGCLLWLGTLVDGYGQFRADGVVQMAHRYALARQIGRPIKPGMLACHKCDTPSCVNPDHLYEGTIHDNASDAVARGQQWRGARLAAAFKSRCRGEAHHSNKLTPSDVMAIFARADSLAVLARKYGVSKTTISKIKRRLIWAEVINKEEQAA